MDAPVDTCWRRGVRSLLVLYLLVMRAAADCPRPQGSDNIVLSNEALLMNDFPNNSEVPLECANGYEIDSGSGIITCIDGSWTEPDLKCKKKDCGPPPPREHMSFNSSEGTLFGALTQVLCDKGYQVRGNSFFQCYASGWSGRARCQIVTCDIRGPVDNGKSSWDSHDAPKYGETIHYTCEVGYTLVGKDSITCMETGKYDSQPPQCIGVTTEESKTLTVVTSTATPPTQDTSTSTESSATLTAHRDKTVTVSPAPTVSPFVPGGRGLLTPEEKATTAREVSTTLSQDQPESVDTKRDHGHVAVIVSVISVTLVVCILALLLHKYLLKRKGSYDTREDLKPELLQFQNL